MLLAGSLRIKLILGDNISFRIGFICSVMELLFVTRHLLKSVKKKKTKLLGENET